MKKYLLIVSLLLVIWLPVTIAAARNVSPAPNIEVAPLSYNYGKLASDQMYIRNFTIKNTGKANLVIGHVYASCGCSKVELESKLVKPGRKINLQVFLDTKGKASGPFSGTLEIESNDPDEPKKIIKLTARIISKNIKKRPPGWRGISAKEFHKQLRNGSALVLVDVRTPEEYRTGHIGGSILVPIEQLAAEAEIKFATKDTMIVVYCKSGKRSEQATKILNQMGYSRVYDLGGIDKWPYGLQKTK
jgi:phage shock protein E